MYASLLGICTPYLDHFAKPPKSLAGNAWDAILKIKVFFWKGFLPVWCH
jgi:hypothetical protein